MENKMNCLFCSKEFIKKPAHKKFCSRYCKEQNRKRVYTKHKKDTCELCGFIPKHPCQLDVDHIDGNHTNNLESNLQTLCANCHRLKTYSQRYL
jgi:hypothetical protein